MDRLIQPLRRGVWWILTLHHSPQIETGSRLDFFFRSLGQSLFPIRIDDVAQIDLEVRSQQFAAEIKLLAKDGLLSVKLPTHIDVVIAQPRKHECDGAFRRLLTG